MSARRDVLHQALLLAAFVLAGCTKSGDAVGADPMPKPAASASVDVAGTSPASSASSSPSTSATVATSAVPTASVTSPEPDALACPSNHGFGEGAGLGVVGGFGGNLSGKPQPTPIVVPIFGLVVSVDGLDGPKASAVICDALTEYRLCAGAARKLDPKVKGKLDLELHVATSGKVEKTVKLATSTLASATLDKCLEKAVSALGFAPPKAPATLVYQFDLPPKTKNVTLAEKGTTVSAGLPVEIVKRIVHANFPRIRACYDQATKTNPKLAGTVSTEFVIDKTGAVESAKFVTGTITETPMINCVVGVFRTLSFPEPESGGAVKVTYPIEFHSEE